MLTADYINLTAKNSTTRFFFAFFLPFLSSTCCRSTPGVRTRDFYYRFEKRWSRGRRPRGLGWKGAKKRQKRIQWYCFPSGLCNPSTLKWTTCISLSVRPIPGPSLSLRGQWLRQAYLDRGLLIWQHTLHQNTCLINDYTRNLFASATCAHSSSITLECALQSQTLLHPHCWSFSKLKFKSFFGHPKGKLAWTCQQNPATAQPRTT